MTIEEWLEKFKAGWVAKDINSVLTLFAKNVIYYETPYLKVESYKQLENEWSAIRNQDEVYLNFKLFSSQDNKHTIIWHLGYATSKSGHRELSGTYLIELDEEGCCIYFHQTGEVKADY